MQQVLRGRTTDFATEEKQRTALQHHVSSIASWCVCLATCSAVSSALQQQRNKVDLHCSIVSLVHIAASLVRFALQQRNKGALHCSVVSSTDLVAWCLWSCNVHCLATWLATLATLPYHLLAAPVALPQHGLQHLLVACLTTRCCSPTARREPRNIDSHTGGALAAW